MNLIDLLDLQGRPHPRALRLAAAIRDALDAVIKGHDDNTGRRCRVNLDGHDGCYTCNLAAAALRGATTWEVDLASEETA